MGLGKSAAAYFAQEIWAPEKVPRISAVRFIRPRTKRPQNDESKFIQKTMVNTGIQKIKKFLSAQDRILYLSNICILWELFNRDVNKHHSCIYQSIRLQCIRRRKYRCTCFPCCCKSRDYDKERWRTRRCQLI